MRPSTETTEIAQAIADELRHAGHEADCLQVDHIDTFDGYDAAVVGRAVYMKRWRPEARRALKRHGKALAERPFWIFSSGPCGQKPDPSWSEPRRTIARAERMGVRGHVVFGGRLPTEPSNFMERSMVDACPPENRDLRHWNADSRLGRRDRHRTEGRPAHRDPRAMIGGLVLALLPRMQSSRSRHSAACVRFAAVSWPDTAGCHQLAAGGAVLKIVASCEELHDLSPPSRRGERSGRLHPVRGNGGE